MTELHPTAGKERIESLDVLRGFAILGILVMNIQSYSMPGAAYLNPMAYGDMTGLNKWVFDLSLVFADNKFMTIFSILFGAGIILMTGNAEKKTGKSAALHYRRNFLLLIIGLIHAHLLWHGDILVPYALCAFIVYFFRKLEPRSLFIIGMLVISIHTVIYMLFGWSIPHWPAESVTEASQGWLPDVAAVEQEISAMTGTLSEQVSHNSKSAVFMETFVFLIFSLWRAGGLMLVGMALYKWKVLTAGRSIKFYCNGLLISFLIGFPLVIYGLIWNYEANWSFELAMFQGKQFNYWGSLFIGFGYICAVMLFAKSERFGAIKSRLAAVGQMALTNYIAQTVICIMIFFGIGFGLFGQIDRTGQALIVLAVWIVQLVWSQPWLKAFRYGPLEWIWRSLSYWERQALRRRG